MIRKLAILALLATCGLHGAIKKAEEQKSAGKSGLRDELRKRAQQGGGDLRMEGKEFEDLLRAALEKEGVPAEKLKDAGLMELLKLVQEKNPEAFRGLRLGGLPGM